ncbi:hypothetical protein BX600DRAFT_471981 [Xylariales sp. PMI_506]|nr:hypothetical protein BX600DRAFT_471981 [Xylariales sp. PMI_506]
METSKNKLRKDYHPGMLTIMGNLFFMWEAVEKDEEATQLMLECVYVYDFGKSGLPLNHSHTTSSHQRIS